MKVIISHPVAHLTTVKEAVRVVRVLPTSFPSGITNASFQTKGGILVGTGVGTYGERSAGADGETLIYDSTSPDGVKTGVVVTLTETGTLTNKRITKRVVTVAQSATPVINTDVGDVFNITGLAQAITSINLTGTPTEGQMFLLNITDNGTSRAITPGASFLGTANNSIAALATTINKVEMLLFKYSAAGKWQLVGRDHDV